MRTPGVSFMLAFVQFSIFVSTQLLPFDDVESSCPCSSDGISGGVDTGRPGCQDHIGDGPFCYVSNPSKYHPSTVLSQPVSSCDSATESTRFPGASWVQCTQCICAEDGVSNGRRTGRRGCALHLDAEDPFCYVQDSSTCPSAQRSRRFRRAAWIDCTLKEALFHAARTDDVEAVIELRDRGADTAESVEVVLEDGGRIRMTLAEYAGAYGSFAVLEDLIIGEEEINCQVEQTPSSVLCSFSNSTNCDANSVQRRAIDRLLREYEEACGPRFAQLVIGTPTPCRRYPYFVSLRGSFDQDYEHFCGGVLIESRFVLTAAHCVDPIFGNPTNPILMIESDASRPGISSCNTDSEFRKSKSVLIHPGWLRGPLARSLGNPDDLALIRLNWRSRKQPIEWEGGEVVNEGAVLTGIGLGRTGQTNTFAPVLQQYEESLQNIETCNFAYDRTFVDGILCIGGSGPDFCEGDDGGPLIEVGGGPGEDRLIGVAHLKDGRIPCGSTGVPGLFIDLNRHQDWIRDNV